MGSVIENVLLGDVTFLQENFFFFQPPVITLYQVQTLERRCGSLQEILLSHNHFKTAEAGLSSDLVQVEI